MKLDFSELTELENKIAGEGQSDFEIIGAKEKRSVNGTNMLIIDAKDPEGGFVRDRICLEGAGAFRAKQFFKAIGISEEEAESMQAADFVGMGFTANIEQEEYEGKLYSKVKKYIA